MKVSFIIAGYGKPDMWRRCIASLLPLKIEEAEFICVEDASGDTRVEVLLNEYANKDKRIIPIIRKENGGVCVARNTALEIATGDYIGFIDFDDIVNPIVLEKAIVFLDDNKACDICAYGVMTIWPDINLSKIDAFSSNCVIKETGQELFLRIHKEVFEKKLFNYVWNKIYRRSFIDDNKIKFLPRAICYEDIVFNLDCLIAGATLGTISEVGYGWFRPLKGTTLARYVPWIEEGIDAEIFRRKKWVAHTNSSMNQIAIKWISNICASREDEIYRNLYRIGSKVTQVTRIGTIRDLYKCSLVTAYVKDIKGLIYAIVRRRLYNRILSRWHIKRIFGDARNWNEVTFV